MHAIFCRRVVVNVVGSSSQVARLLMKQPSLSHRSQIRHFMSSSSSSSSSATRFQKFHGGFFGSTLRDTNLKLKLGNLLESRAGFFEFETKGFTGFQKRRWKSWFNGTNGVVFGLIMANAAVFTIWRISDSNIPWMTKNFVLTRYSVLNGRIHTLITQGFSHVGISDMVMNMLELYYFGTRIANTLGPLYLLKLYFAGTLGGSVFFLSYHALVALLMGQGVVIKNQSELPLKLMGAEGSVFAITLLDIFLYPKVTTYVGLILRVPVIAGIIMLGHNMLQMVEGQQNNFSLRLNQLGGATVAAIAWKSLRKGRFCY